MAMKPMTTTLLMHSLRRSAICLNIVVLIVFGNSLGFAQTDHRGASVLRVEKNKVSYEVVPFSFLQFGYKPPFDVENPDGTVTKAADKPMSFPETIKALDGAKVAITGFVLPLESDEENVKTFLLAGELVTCLFCQGLSMDQWLFAQVNNPKGIRIKDEQFEMPWTIYGTLHVGEEYKEGQLINIYRFDVESAQIAK